jgi:DNA-binding NarL/FixJ family response regulator
MVRAGVRAELGSGFDVVGEWGDAVAAVAGIRAVRADVVLLDVYLPGGGARAVLDAVLAEPDPPYFLALSVSDAARDVLEVVRGGARGYATKAISGPELRAAIRLVHGGDAYFSPRLAAFVLDAYRASVEDSRPADDLTALTARERDVLRYVAAGYTYREVAGRLHISVRTVETHAAAVLRKLQIPNRRELARWAAGRRI